MTHTPSDRVQVRQLGELLHPAACALCGNGTCPDGYLDTSVFYDYEGTVYFCMRCVEDFIECVGALLPSQVNHLNEVSEEVAKRNKELEAENNELRRKLDAWYTVIDGAIDYRNAGGTSEPVPAVSAESNSEPADGAGKGESVPKKPTPKRRPHDASQSKSSNLTV